MSRFPGLRTGMSFSLPALCAALWKASLGFQLGLSAGHLAHLQVGSNFGVSIRHT